MSRYDDLRRECDGNDVKIAAAFHRFIGHEQFQYRNQLHGFAGEGDERRVADWVIEMYDKKDILRRVWRGLERSGEAEDWVKHVGEGGTHEWVDLLRRMLRRAEERGDVESALENQDAKL